MRSKEQIAAYEKRLEKVAKTLAKKPMSAVQLAEYFEVARATAYAWIEAMPQYGYKLKVTKVQGSSGPPLGIYVLAKMPAKPAKAKARS